MTIRTEMSISIYNVNINNLQCWLYCSSFPELRSPPSFLLASVTVIPRMSHCLALCCLFHTLSKMEIELWEALQGGDGSGLERSVALIWRQLTPTVRISIGAKCIKSTFQHAKLSPVS